MDENPEASAAGPVVWAVLAEVMARTGLWSLLLKTHKNSVKSTAQKNMLLLLVPGV